MFSGALILESMRVGTRLGDLNIVVRELYRFQPEGTTADQPGTRASLSLTSVTMMRRT
jgi:hypothetical protein